jgi:hypothetical protein
VLDAGRRHETTAADRAGPPFETNEADHLCAQAIVDALDAPAGRGDAIRLR